MEVPVDSQVKKRIHKKESIARKQVRALMNTQDYIDLAFDIMTNVYNTVDVMMMKHFLDSLHFIHDVFKDFCKEFHDIEYPNGIRTNRVNYYPRLIDMYQRDCHALIHDLLVFGKKMKSFVKFSTDVKALNVYIRLSSTVLYYLQIVKKRNPPFFDKPPAYVRRAYVGRRRWWFYHYS